MVCCKVITCRDIYRVGHRQRLRNSIDAVTLRQNDVASVIQSQIAGAVDRQRIQYSRITAVLQQIDARIVETADVHVAERVVGTRRA
ncbi:hypothetical protein GCM10007901_06480 [Dyella acidisoli]|uniref:Uncharacterized protein n=1 Tax=Dyella acidisoli TaxID=1867834 RepID=A0ABQ5XJ58_9GAMM|nr:hypothetical protein GCM10007901_06480 [Dyella acidisoli]